MKLTHVPAGAAVTEPKTTRVLLRRRTFEAKGVEELKTLLEKLCSDKHTGPIRIEMAQGGIRTVSVEDQSTLPT